MRTVVIKMLKDGSGRACVHWFRVDPKGPITTPSKTVPTMMGPMKFGGVQGYIACNPAQNTVTPQQVGNDIYQCCRSEEPRAVTCPDCMATPEFKAAMEEIESMFDIAKEAG